MTLLSICIPCYGRVEYVRKTLKSIFIDNADVPLEKYEVIISDNDSNQAIKVLTEEFKYPNLRYFYTNCEGFMNSYYVLTYAQGEFFKLHNSQTLFRKGSLSKIISEIKNNIENKTLIFYTNGLLGSRKSQTYSNFNDFMYNLSYWSSWSNGFNIWKSEFDKIDKNLKLNKLFPHTSLFLTQHQAKLFCIMITYYLMYKEYLNEGDIINLRHLQLSILRCWMNVVRKGIFQRNVKDTYYLELWYSFFRLYFLINILFE